MTERSPVCWNILDTRDTPKMIINQMENYIIVDVITMFHYQTACNCKYLPLKVTLTSLSPGGPGPLTWSSFTPRDMVQQL